MKDELCVGFSNEYDFIGFRERDSASMHICVGNENNWQWASWLQSEEQNAKAKV